MSRSITSRTESAKYIERLIELPGVRVTDDFDISQVDKIKTSEFVEFITSKIFLVDSRNLRHSHVFRRFTKDGEIPQTESEEIYSTHVWTC